MSKTDCRTLFVDQFSGLEKHIATLEKHLEELQIHLNQIPGHRIDEDFSSILKATTTLKKLCYEYEFQNAINQDQFLDEIKEYRHDLRAACGGVIGYSELAREELEALGHNDKKLLEEISDIIEVSHGMLEIIALMTVVNQTGSLRQKVSKLQTTQFKGSLLIIDDNPEKLKMLRRRVEQIGHSVLTATGGLQGLEAITKRLPDLILLDLIMPDINGLEVLIKLKADSSLKDIPVLMISSTSDMDTVIECIKQGADDYLPTPIDNTLLFSRIESCLTKKFSRDREVQVMQALEEARMRLATAIESIDEGFAIFDSQDRLISYNSKFIDLYPAVSTLTLESSTYEDFLNANIAQETYALERRKKKKVETDSSNPLSSNDIKAWCEDALKHHRNPQTPQVHLLKDGRWIESIENKIPSGGTVAVHKDISDRMRREQKLEYQAHHDALTGLINRKGFEMKLEKTLREAQDNKEILGLLFFDLDGFKKVNDTLGHDFGDFLLKEVAQKLSHCLRTTDHLARMGGDEFVAIITDNPTLDQLEIIATRSLKALGNQVEQDGKIANFGMSIGIAAYPEHGKNPKALVTQADKAMYAAKRKGKNTFVFAQIA